jgi:hypothetical protein
MGALPRLVNANSQSMVLFGLPRTNNSVGVSPGSFLRQLLSGENGVRAVQVRLIGVSRL